MIIVIIVPAPKLPRVVPFSDGRVVIVSPKVAEALSRLMDEVDEGEVRARAKLVYERLRRINKEFPVLWPRQDDPVRLVLFMDGPAARLAPAGSRPEVLRCRCRRPRSTAWYMPPSWSSCTRHGTGYRHPPWPAGLLRLGIAATLTANMPQGWSHGLVGRVVAASLAGSYELRPGSSVPPGHRNASHQQGTAANLRVAAPRRNAPQPQPLAAQPERPRSVRSGSAAEGSAPPGNRPTLPARRMVTGYLKPMPMMTQRWPRTSALNAV